jgi:ureidoacrylate peracid hydrolase
MAKTRTKIIGFTGIATNVCVESTLRDAFFAEFFPVLFEDACLQNGSPSTQSASLETVRACFGWTSTSRQFIQALANLG